MAAFRRAVLSVDPDRLEQFTSEVKRNIGEKPSRKRHKIKDKSPNRSTSKKRRKHSDHAKEKSNKSANTSRRKERHVKKKSSSDSPDHNVKRHNKLSKNKSSGGSKSKEESDFDDKDLDLSIPIVDLSTMVKDRQALLDTIFSVVKVPKLTAMLPDILKLTPIEEIKKLCGEHLKVMSSKRILHILAGTEMESSSGTDSSDDEKPKKIQNRPVVTPSHEYTLQTNLVDSTTSENSGPAMLFPSAMSTAKSATDNISSKVKEEHDNVSTTSAEMNISFNEVKKDDMSTSSSDVEDGEVASSPGSSSDKRSSEIDMLTEKEVIAEDLVVDELMVEEIEEINIPTTEMNKEKPLIEKGDPISSKEEYAGKSQLEILELELRARAIRSLMNAAKSGKLK